MPINDSIDNDAKRPFWLVGASYGGVDDQTKKFIDEGIWMNGNDVQDISLVKEMAVGDRMAIKAVYTKKNNLPFD